MASPSSAGADAAWAKDPDWIVPILWRSEFQNALAGSIRQRALGVEEASAIANLAETMPIERSSQFRPLRFFNSFRDQIARLMTVSSSRWHTRTEFGC
jgi:hypothetical protein